MTRNLLLFKGTLSGNEDGLVMQEDKIAVRFYGPERNIESAVVTIDFVKEKCE